MMNKSRADNNPSTSAAKRATSFINGLASRTAQLGVLMSLCLAAAPNPAAAQRAYDGNWSVLIVTERGDCDRAYRYGVLIRNGGVYNEGGAVNLSGRVAANGNVSVNVQSSNAAASGSGRLGRNTGQGRWNGYSGQSRCSGYWTAERRG
jgi:hypothetical protein